MHFTEVNHYSVGQSVVLLPRDSNHSKWVLFTTSASIVLHQARKQSNRSFDAIHSLVVTTRSRLGSREQPLFMLHSARRHLWGSTSSVLLIVVVIRSRIGMDNRYTICNRLLEIGIQNRINQYSKPTRLVFKFDYNDIRWASRLHPTTVRSRLRTESRKPTPMISTFGSSEMSLRKFDRLNFNF